MRTCTAVGVSALVLAGCGAGFQVRGATEPVRSAAVATSPDAAFGRTVRVTVPPVRIYGELIGCDAEWLYLRVHEASPDAWQRVHWSEGPAVDVALPSNGPAILAWTIAGAVSTLTHGFFALITLPVWAVVGSVATTFSWNPRLGLESCDAARPYARFPQGLPAAFLARFQGRFDEQTRHERPTAAPSDAHELATPAAPWDAPASPAEALPPSPSQPPAH